MFLYKIQVVDSIGSTPFKFESTCEYKDAINLLKTCKGESIQQTPCHFVFRAHSDEAREKLTNFQASLK